MGEAWGPTAWGGGGGEKCSFNQCMHNLQDDHVSRQLCCAAKGLFVIVLQMHYKLSQEKASKKTGAEQLSKST